MDTPHGHIILSPPSRSHLPILGWMISSEKNIMHGQSDMGNLPVTSPVLRISSLISCFKCNTTRKPVNSIFWMNSGIVSLRLIFLFCTRKISCNRTHVSNTISTSRSNWYSRIAVTEKEFESGKNDETSRNKETNNSEPKAVSASSKQSSDNVVDVELIVDEEPVPRVRMLDSATIPRVTPVGSPTRPNYATQRDHQQQQPNPSTRKVSLDPSPVLPNYSGRRMVYSSTTRPPTSVSQNHQRDPRQPRVYPQSQAIDQPPRPRRKRRLVRIGPDKILWYGHGMKIRNERLSYLVGGSNFENWYHPSNKRLTNTNVHGMNVAF